MLYWTGRGQVVKYDIEAWNLGSFETETGGLGVRQQFNTEDETENLTNEDERFLFPIEAHLRDFLIKNLRTIKQEQLSLYVDELGRDGKEYPTDVGPIDILAVDGSKNFVVFELKLSKGPDRALGQILRYMGWVKR